MKDLILFFTITLTLAAASVLKTQNQDTTPVTKFPVAVTTNP